MLSKLIWTFNCIVRNSSLTTPSRIVLLVIMMLGSSVHAEQSLVIEVGKGILLPTERNVEAIFVADHAVADVKSSPGEQIFVVGKAVGETTLTATRLEGGLLFEYQIVIIEDLIGLRRDLRRRFPEEQILLHSAKGSIYVSGTVSDARVYQNMMTTIRAGLPEIEIIDDVVVKESNLIRLDVSLLEVSSDSAEQFGVDLRASMAFDGFFFGTDNRGVFGAGYNRVADISNVSATLDLLITNDIASILSETSLTTISGKEAEFSVGGEVPIPVFSEKSDSYGGNYSVDFKFVGMNLRFKPNRISDDKLYLSIESFISSVDGTFSDINGNNFPNLSSRSFVTDVELRDKQSFVIAGLSQQQLNSALRIARDEPLSRLFDFFLGTDGVTSANQELLVVVTPIFTSLEAPRVDQQLRAPASNLEHIISRAQTASAKRNVEFHGPAGFLY